MGVSSWLHTYYTVMQSLLSLLFLSCLVFGQQPPLVEPPEGQRCSGRNYNGRRCCTPEEPCGLGEGDCDGPLDGGVNDGHAGCQGDLVCGSNNCKKFGAYYHDKDDCCERAEKGGPRQQEIGWGPWSEFSPCSASCGPGWEVRTRQCVGNRCGQQGFHKEDRQERICIKPDCNDIF